MFRIFFSEPNSQILTQKVKITNFSCLPVNFFFISKVCSPTYQKSRTTVFFWKFFFVGQNCEGKKSYGKLIIIICLLIIFSKSTVNCQKMKDRSHLNSASLQPQTNSTIATKRALTIESQFCDNKITNRWHHSARTMNNLIAVSKS